ncbi:sugar ABC transporter ATP-binding protein [Treponema sp. OMZ 840]|uniref:sugar ABC transporter ATP-binding protein n=1 Tax=Treponema sp. OMZ 840 TaxID=244313 RepID=UPI003D926F87
MENKILRMEGISKSFPGVKALSNVDFSVKRGEVRCLIGANGAGKSTLMKILSGAYQRDAGRIFLNDREIEVLNTQIAIEAGIAVIYQELSLIDSLTVAENIFLNNYANVTTGKFLDWKKMNDKTLELLREFNITISPASLAGDLTIGHRQLVEILKAVARDAKIIVMDEPSATLSKDEYTSLLRIIEALKQKEITIIYISHRLEELFDVGDSVTILLDGNHIATISMQEITQEEIVRLMIGHEVKSFFRKQKKQTTETILELCNVTTKSITEVNLKIKKSEIHGIYGLVGSGRTEVLNSIFGIDPVLSGEIIYENKKINNKNPYNAIKKEMGLVPENRKKQGLVLGLPVWENSSLAGIKNFLRFGVIQYGKIYAATEKYIKKLSIKTPGINNEVSTLSGGNQQKVVLSKWLIKQCNLLLVDEPTQGIDIGAKAEIYEILEDLADKGKTIIIVSSELNELLSVASAISVMYEGKLVKTFDDHELDATKIQECAITGRI